MPTGASWQFNAPIDGPNLDDAKVNTLDSGFNVYHEGGAGLNVSVTAGRFGASVGYVDFAGVTGIAIPPSTAARALWIDTAGAFQQGAVFPGGEFYPLAEVDTSGTDVIAIVDKRPKGGGTSIAGGGAPTGPAAGDLAGTYPNPTVATVGGTAAATIGAHPADAANPHGVTAVQAGAIDLAALGAANGVATLNVGSLVNQEPASKGLPSGVASLDGGSKVVQDPASATATPGAAAIPIADGSGTLDAWVTNVPANALAKLYVASGDPSVHGSRLMFPKFTAFGLGGTVQYMQLFLPGGASFDFLETFLTGGGATGESIRMAIYDQTVPTDPAGIPNAKVQETAVRLLNGGDDSTFVAEALGAPVVSPAGGAFFWLALICSGVVSTFAGSETAPLDYLARREEASVGTTLPAGAAGLTNPASAAIYVAARRV